MKRIISSVNEHGGYRKKLTLEERELIQKYIKKRISCGEIAKVINRSKNCVVSEIRSNGGPENYNAKEAQERSDNNQKIANEKRSEQNKKTKQNIQNNSTKIRNLEMQIDILFEEIQKLRKS